MFCPGETSYYDTFNFIFSYLKYFLLRMDKYVIRTKKDANSSASNGSTRGLRQARLHQLQGVVVLEEFHEANTKLTNPDVTPSKKLEILRKIQGKKPGKEVLKSTGIGRTVHKLCKSPNTEVAELASAIYACWKSHVLHILHRKPIEVKSDLETEKARQSAQKLINMGLNNPLLAEQLENYVFKHCKKLINKTYNRVIRKIHFTLKNNEELRETVNNLDCDLSEFVDDMHKQVIKVYSH